MLSVAVTLALLLGVFTGASNFSPRALAENAEPAVKKIVPTFTGDPRTEKGFTWYTNLDSERSDLQLVKKTGRSGKKPDFKKARTFNGTSYVSSNDSGERVHKVNAKGLKADTAYFYRVGDAKRNIWSKVGTVKTAPKKNGAFTFLELTDPQAKTEDEGKLAADTFNKASATVKHYDFMTVTGDIVDNGVVEDQWDWLINNSRSVWGDTTVVPAAGNHESENDAFIDHFNLKPATINQDTTTGAYYSFNYSNTHFVVLNTNEDSEQYRDFTPDQVKWMAADIKKAKANGAKWTVVLMHKGPYTTSNHATDSDIIGQNGVRNQIAPLIGKLGVDLVIQGHDHIYARTLPINKRNEATHPTTITEWLNGEKIDYAVKPNGAIYYIPATAGPKVYKKNTDPVLGDAFYSKFARAEENHALKYGLDPSDPTRPVRGAIQNFSSVTIDKNKLSVVVYEIDRIKGTDPYIIDQFGIIK
ncbi:metallophosphoesterase family protein [Sporolactobacillus sp. CPB3-1]|uniref:Metallophosphoesterase family protein n=1 Tax=Sporolactobacillus mangiferae TaxID=2940498 RepID=A0ABT0MB54_9BACL|nr:metallophosphoesterase family protein [Sporolactobacillus mangiferae]MCL1632092.1 metallophosphoesterase family protein [Sporolactobacillus mangiferae]